LCQQTALCKDALVKKHHPPQTATFYVFLLNINSIRMNFIDFLKSFPPQGDKRLQSFIDFAKNDKTFPRTSDPSKLAIYLYKTLDPPATLAFQNCLMIYSKTPDNELPKRFFGREDMALMAINIIVSLQNFDSEYPWN
jgi:hypothetical protein